MIQEYYNAGAQEFFAKLAKLSDLTHVLPGGNLPASTLMRSGAKAAAPRAPLATKSTPSTAWQHGSVLTYGKNPTIRPRAAGET